MGQGSSVFKRFILLGLLLGATANARAAGDAPLWEAGLGVAGISFPDYRGSDQQRGYLVPLPYLIYRGDRLRLDRHGLRGLLFSSERLALDLSMDGAVPVNSKNNDARQGMPDLDPAIEFGPSLDYTLQDSPERLVRLRLAVRTLLATNLRRLHQEGWIANPNLNISSGGRWNTGLSVGPLFATRAYHAYYYDVAPAYATADRPAYTARGGYSGFRLALSLSRRYRRFWLGGFLRYDDLHGAVFADSPLVKRKSALMAGFGIAWVLNQSQRRVPRTLADAQ